MYSIETITEINNVVSSIHLSNGRENRDDLVIFAINTTPWPASLEEKAKELAEVSLCLLDIPLKQVIGCYKGEFEVSYVAKVNSILSLARVTELCIEHKQESILLIDTKREASLYFLDDGSLLPVGAFVKSNPKEAMESDNFTLDGCQFYVVK